MRRLGLLPLLFLLAGCGALSASDEAPPLALADAAEPQVHEVRWRESYGTGNSVLRFDVRRFAVTEQGWAAVVSIENSTSTTFELGSRPLAFAFGLMLFTDGRAETLERLNRAGELPTLRRARIVDPEPPGRLAPGQRWDGTLSAPGALPSNSWVRVVFGTLFVVGEPPEGLQSTILWITDHAVRLR